MDFEQLQIKVLTALRESRIYPDELFVYCVRTQNIPSSCQVNEVTAAVPLAMCVNAHITLNLKMDFVSVAV